MSVCLLLIARLLVVIAFLGVIVGLALSAYMWYLYFQVLKTVKELNASQSRLSERKLANDSLLRYFNKSTSTINASVPANALFSDLSSVNVYTYDTNTAVRDEAFGDVPNPNNNLAGALVVSLVALILIILLIFFRKHMKIIIKIFEESCYAIFCIPCVLLQPVVSLIFLILMLFYFFAITAYIYAIEEPVVDERMFVEFEEDNSTSRDGLFAAHVLGCYAVWQFAAACEQMIVAGAIANWYYRRERIGDCCPNSRIGICPTLGPTIYVMKYNLGTAAAGSLLITLTAAFRLVLDYAKKKSQEHEGTSPIMKAMHYLFSCLNLCCGCVNEIIKFVSHNAYIVAGMTGSSFISSGKRALSLLIVSATTAWVLNIVSVFLLFLAKFLVAIVAGGISYYYFKQALGESAGLSDYWFPVFLVTIMSYAISWCFFSAFGYVLDTIFLCYCDDMDRHGGVPRFSSDRLKESMNDVKSKKFDQFNKDEDVPHPSTRTSSKTKCVRKLVFGSGCSSPEIQELRCTLSNHNSDCNLKNNNVIYSSLSTLEYSRENSLSISEVIINVDMCRDLRN